MGDCEERAHLEEPVEGEEEVLDVLVEEGALQVGAVDLRRPQALVLPVCMHARGQGEGKGSYVSGLPETSPAERGNARRRSPRIRVRPSRLCGTPWRPARAG